MDLVDLKVAIFEEIMKHEIRATDSQVNIAIAVSTRHLHTHQNVRLTAHIVTNGSVNMTI